MTTQHAGPGPQTELLDELMNRLEAARTESERRILGALVGEALIEAGRREYRNWCVVSHLLVEVRAGHEVEAAAWLARQGIETGPRRRKRKSRRRALGRELERAGIEPFDVPDELFDVTTRWRVRRRRRKHASHLLRRLSLAPCR